MGFYTGFGVTEGAALSLCCTECGLGLVVAEKETELQIKGQL